MFSYHGLGEGPSQVEEQRHQPPAAVNGGVHHVPRVHCVAADALEGEPTMQLVGEQDVAELGAVVRQHGPVVFLRRGQKRQVYLPT